MICVESGIIDRNGPGIIGHNEIETTTRWTRLKNSGTCEGIQFGLLRNECGILLHRPCAFCMIKHRHPTRRASFATEDGCEAISPAKDGTTSVFSQRNDLRMTMPRLIDH
jgi:hypothetical protein